MGRRRGEENKQLQGPHHPKRRRAGKGVLAGNLPWVELVDDALESDDGKESGREAADPGEQENRKGNQAAVAGVFRVFGADTTHRSSRFVWPCTRNDLGHDWARNGDCWAPASPGFSTISILSNDTSSIRMNSSVGE